MLKHVLIALALVVVTFVVLFACHYFLLWKPSLQGKCGGRRLGTPEPPLPHITRFRGQVVGKELWVLQYRWDRNFLKFFPVAISLAFLRACSIIGLACVSTLLPDSGLFDSPGVTGCAYTTACTPGDTFV